MRPTVLAASLVALIGVIHAQGDACSYSVESVVRTQGRDYKVASYGMSNASAAGANIAGEAWMKSWGPNQRTLVSATSAMLKGSVEHIRVPECPPVVFNAVAQLGARVHTKISRTNAASTATIGGVEHLQSTALGSLDLAIGAGNATSGLLTNIPVPLPLPNGSILIIPIPVGTPQGATEDIQQASPIAAGARITEIEHVTGSSAIRDSVSYSSAWPGYAGLAWGSAQAWVEYSLAAIETFSQCPVHSSLGSLQSSVQWNSTYHAF